MRSITKFSRIYLPFSKFALQKLMSYKISFIMFLVGDLLKVFLFYFLWLAVFKNSNSLAMSGLTALDMIDYTFMSCITASMIHSNVANSIGEQVKDGSISMNLIKPISYPLSLFFSTLGEYLYKVCVLLIPGTLVLMIIKYVQYGYVSNNISSILFYLLSSILGLILVFVFEYCFGILSFYVTNIWGINQMKLIIVRFLSGELIPIILFPNCIINILEFLPFSSMIYVPTMIFMGKIQGINLLFAYGIQIFWIVILLLISKVLWNKAYERLTILGG